VFISISVDAKKAYKSWKTMVKEEELGGVQLFADNSFDSEFAEAYGITSIPRFIIVDQEGKVYDDKAPSPSFEQTKALLQDLLK
jgi:thioredoxin-related protein